MEIKGSPNSNSCRKATGGTGSHAQKNNNRANESVSLSKKNSSNSQIDKAVCMVQLDVCEEVKEYGGMLEDTWSDSIGRIFWGKSEQETSQYPRGDFLLGDLSIIELELYVNVGRSIRLLDTPPLTRGVSTSWCGVGGIAALSRSIFSIKCCD